MIGVFVWFSLVQTVVYCWPDNWLGDLFNPKSNQLQAKTNNNQRNSRFLSLFTYVQYQIPECVDGDGNYGTCTSPSECIARGGTINGPCAGGYGACCLFFATCGTTIRENGTYFVNNDYPEQFDGTGSCQVTLLKSNPDICQFRLDFAELNIMQPDEQNHICNNDQFLASGGNPAPVICGNNKGNHMYIDTAPGLVTPVTLTVLTSGPSFPRKWKIRILQIPCNVNYKAEQGCLQYFTGVSGQILSYNYDPVAGAQLSNQDYSICVRPEWNFCGIQYSQCPNTDADLNSNQSFTLSGNSNNRVPAMVGSTGNSNYCQSDYLIIPMASNVGRPATGLSSSVDRICGGVLSADVTTMPTTVRSNVRPFHMYFHSDGIEAPNDIDNKGFCLNYIQVPCANAFT